MISELVKELRWIAEHEYQSRNSEGTIRKAADTIEMLSEKVRADRPQGEWVTEYNGNGWNDYWNYTCSNCGKKYERADTVLYNARYCPNCGARMKGADDE